MESISLAQRIEHSIDEIDAIAVLLGIARKAPQDERYGYDIEFLDETMLRRIRELARYCQGAVCADLHDYEIPTYRYERE